MIEAMDALDRVIAVEHGPTGSNRDEPEGSAEGGSLRAMTRAV